jgi:hypothetical protein
MFRFLSTLLLALTLAACGGQQQRVVGLEESTTLIIRGEGLVGATVSVGDGFRRTIAENDLTAYELGVLGAKDSENERLETITLKVDAGDQRVTVQQSGRVLVDKTMYFTDGQTREVRVTQ